MQTDDLSKAPRAATIDSARPVAWTPPRETARFDPAPLERLYADLGPVSAEQAVCRALDTLTARLEDARRADGAARAAAARGAQGVAREVGLTSLAAAAHAAADAAHDPVAAAATFGRLERMADASMAAIWDMGSDSA